MLVVDDDIEKPHEVLVMKKYYLHNSLQKVWEKTEWGRGGEAGMEKIFNLNLSSPPHLLKTGEVLTEDP